jgi:uncharacterized membrane protein YuzA (DUF378 family)
METPTKKKNLFLHSICISTFIMNAKQLIFWVLFAVVIVGALNWGLVAINGDKTNLVKRISMGNKLVERSIYASVGVSAVALIGLTIAFEAERAKAEKNFARRA